MEKVTRNAVLAAIVAAVIVGFFTPLGQSLFTWMKGRIASPSPKLVPIYQLYAERDRERYRLTPSLEEAKSGWSNDGALFRAFSNSTKETVPVYELQAAGKPDRFRYSTDPTDASGLWGYESVKFYAYKEKKEGTVPLYEFQLATIHCSWDLTWRDGKPESEWTCDDTTVDDDRDSRYRYSLSDADSVWILVRGIKKGWICDAIKFYVTPLESVAP